MKMKIQPFKPGYLMSKQAMKRTFLKPTIEKKTSGDGGLATEINQKIKITGLYKTKVFTFLSL
jgi:phage-related protein